MSFAARRKGLRPISVRKKKHSLIFVLIMSIADQKLITQVTLNKELFPVSWFNKDTKNIGPLNGISFVKNRCGY